MKSLIFIFALFTITLTNAQTSTTFVKTIQLDSVKYLKQELNANVQCKVIKGSRIIVEQQITVKLADPRLEEAVLTFVKKSNYCEYKQYFDNTTKELKLVSPEQKAIITKGGQAEIIVKYVIYVPENVKFNNHIFVNN